MDITQLAWLFTGLSVGNLGLDIIFISISLITPKVFTSNTPQHMFMTVQLMTGFAILVGRPIMAAYVFLLATITCFIVIYGEETF